MDITEVRVFLKDLPDKNLKPIATEKFTMPFVVGK